MTLHAMPRWDPWRWTQALSETFAAGLDPQGIALRQRDARLASLLLAAQASPLYRRRAGTPTRLQDFEPIAKAELMRHFDDWATDRRITRRSVDAFLRDPQNLADAYLGDYLVWTSSGTSGEPGIFVQDAASLAVFDALDALRLRGLNQQLPAWHSGQRFAFVAATGGHFAGVASIKRLQRLAAMMLPPPLQWLAPALRTFSVLEPLADLAHQLQDYAPTVLITYPSCAAALAQLQAAGTLRLGLSEVWLGGEQLSAEQRGLFRSRFGCTLRNNYGASEIFSIASECAAGQLHLNHDWVVLTNLANHAQPLLRYRLSDRVRFAPGRCACGNAFPVIEVQGRAEQTLCLTDPQGQPVTLLPLALLTAIEEGAQVTQFQLLCTGAQRQAVPHH